MVKMIVLLYIAEIDRTLYHYFDLNPLVVQPFDFRCRDACFI